MAKILSFCEIKEAVRWWLGQYTQNALGWNPARRTVQRAMQRYLHDVIAWFHPTPCRTLRLRTWISQNGAMRYWFFPTRLALLKRNELQFIKNVQPLAYMPLPWLSVCCLNPKLHKSFPRAYNLKTDTDVLLPYLTDRWCCIMVGTYNCKHLNCVVRTLQHLNSNFYRKVSGPFLSETT
jgi:hypothetical protein